MAKVNVKKVKSIKKGFNTKRGNLTVNLTTKSGFKASAKRPPNKSANDAKGSQQTLMRRSGKLLEVTQPINDLRQLIKAKGAPKAATKNAIVSNPQSAGKKESIKKRLGLQSASARNRAKLAVQVTTANVQAGTGGVKKAGQKLRAWRQRGQQQQQPQAQSILLPQAFPSQGPPVMMIAAPNVASTALNAQPSQTGFSVIISNLNPSVTQSEINELFGEIGPVQSIQVINSSTAMVTYFNAGHAAQAISEYNNRYLDGQPMQVTLIPSPNTTGNVVRRAFREAFAP